MSRFFVTLCVLLLGTCSSTIGFAESTSSQNAAKLALHEKLFERALSFEENKGQIAAPVEFLSRGRNFNLLLTPNAAIYQLPDPGCSNRRQERSAPFEQVKSDLCQVVSLEMKMLNASGQGQVSGEGKLETETDYFIGNDESRWHRGISSFEAIRYRNIYKGIDLVYRGSEQHLEYDFHLQPGARPELIELEFSGANKVELTRSGDLVFAFKGLEINHRAPVAYQIIDGEERLVPAKFVLSGKNRVGFRIGEFDSSKELVIDPVVYASYLGGAIGGDSVNDIVVDRSGNIYIASQEFVFVPPNSSYSDILITKLNPKGTIPAIYKRYIGGRHDDTPYGMDVSADGDVYITGITYSQDFPMRFAHQSTHAISVLNLDFMAYYVRLNPDGEIRHSTFLGGGCPGTHTQNYANSIVTDSEGNAYLTGYTCSPSFPVKDAFQSTLQGSYNSFLTKYDSFGHISYSTYFGGSSGDTSFGDIALDRQSNAYITGSAVAGLYTTAGAYSASGNGFVAKFDTNATGSQSLVYSTYIPDRGYSIAVDPGGNTWIGSNSSLLKLNSVGTSLLFNRQGIASRLNDIAVDQNGSVYYASVGTSVDFKLIGLRPDGSLIREVTVGTGTSRIKASVWGIALGGPEEDMIYVGGKTRAFDFPSTSDAYQPSSNTTTSFGQGFFAKVSLINEPLIFIPGIAGSSLYEADSNGDPVIHTLPDITEIWPNGVFDLRPSGFNLSGRTLPKLFLDPEPHASIVAVDALPNIVHTSIYPIYEPLLENFLVKKEGYVRYDIKGNPKKRFVTGSDSGCIRAYDGEKPTLFVFAYDWRKTNVDAAKDLGRFIECVQLFHPGKKVNILTHSLGGLVARRYLLEHQGEQKVNKLITIVAPFLGAPKVLDVLLTGRFLPSIPIVGFYLHTNNIKRIVSYSPGAHELLPSEWYYNLVDENERPFGYKKNVSGMPYEYDFEKAKQVLNSKLPSHPYQASDDFHGYPSRTNLQDNWSLDSSGVKFYHIYGVQYFDQTIGQVFTAPFVSYGMTKEEKKFGVETKHTKGDGTVPVVSASRSREQSSWSALVTPGALVKRCASPSKASDNDYSHNGILSSQILWSEIKAMLDNKNISQPQCIVEETSSSPKTLQGAVGENKDLSSDEALDSLVNTLKVYGVDRLQITDEYGNTNTPVSFDVDQAVPEIDYVYGSDSADALVFPHEVTFVAGKMVDIKFIATTQKIRIVLSKGTSRAISAETVKYMDLQLPVGVTAWLKFTTDGAENLRYDANGDGLFEAEVQPTFRLTGAAASDETAPDIDISLAVDSDAATVTLSSVDTETGINQIRYAVDGEAIDHVYTAPFQLDLGQSKLLYVSAEDRAGNRSLLAKWIDIAPPASGTNQAPAANSAGWSKTDVNVELKSLDDLGGAGVESLTFAVTGAQPIPEETLTAPQDAPFTFPQPAGPSDFLAKNIEVNAEGITTLTFFAKDRAGNLEAAKTVAVKIDKTPPVSAGGFELTGGRATVALAGTDALSGVGSVAYSIDGGAMQSYLTPFVVTGGGDHTITYFATDVAGNVEPSQNLAFKIEGGNPSVSIAAPASGAIFPVRTAVNFTGSFSGDQCGTHNAVWTFNNLTQAGIVNETSRLVTVTRAFTEAGVYQVQLTVDNGCGGTGSANAVGGLPALVVVYDPEGSFVTGGGWFNSPAGAFAGAPNFVGKASFGFNSKYPKGESAPTGNTLFQLQAGDFSFKSTGYEWLVVSGAKAQYKGSGTVNGSGNYGFILTANDGQINGGADRVRIRIWERNTNVVVYDSQPGAPDGSNASTGLGGGSVVIH